MNPENKVLPFDILMCTDLHAPVMIYSWYVLYYIIFSPASVSCRHDYIKNYWTDFLDTWMEDESRKMSLKEKMHLNWTK